MQKERNKGLVSVCLLTYNQEKYIEDNLKSLLSQTYNKMELIILDDASDDSTQEIIKSYKDKLDEKFIEVKFIFHSVNSGNIPQNVNEMLSKASGEYIKEFAGDDIMLADCVERLVEVAESNEEIMVVHSNGYIENETYRYGNEHSWRLFRDYSEGCEKGNVFLRLMYTNSVLAPTALIRSSVFEKLGYYDEKIDFEDYDMWLKIAVNGGKFYYIDSPLVAYRRTKNSLTFVSKGNEEVKTLYKIKAGIQVRRKYLGYLNEEDQKRVCKFVYDAYILWAEKIDSDECRKCLQEFYNTSVTETKQNIFGLSNSEKAEAEINILCKFIDYYEKVDLFVGNLKNSAKTVAIFGYSKIGRRLYCVMKKKELNVSYIIDRKGPGVFAPVKVYTIDEELPKVDIVIVTAINAYANVKDVLHDKTNAEIISFMEVLFQNENDVK